MSFNYLLNKYFRSVYYRNLLLMKSLQHIIITSFFIFQCLFLAAQNSKYDTVNFRSPLDIPLILAGNFAELRPNHFHTGIDIKTQGVEGKKIYAVENGYISRIKISHYGYGRVIYVTHPNGYTTVYAHLQKFNEKIENVLREEQYKSLTELIDVELPSDVIPVQKGEVIAFSGNTGSSTAPHLHFEIRDTKTEYALNPLLFKFDINDDIKPTVNGVKIYALENGFINGKNEDVKYSLTSNGDYFTINKPIEVDGQIGFAIHTIDRLNGAHNKCGAYKINLFVDDSLVISQKLDYMDFDKNRFINAYKDYEEYHKNNFHYHRSFLLPNNPLNIYETDNRGIISFSDNITHKIEYHVYDVYGNMSKVKFNVKHNANMKKQEFQKNTDNEIDIESLFQIENENYKLSFEDSTFYENQILDINYNKTNQHLNIGNKYIPAQKYFALKMNAIHIDDSLRNKTFIAKIDKGQIKPRGGYVEGNFINTDIKELGEYTLVIDTIAPVLTPLNFHNNIEYSGWMAFKFSAKDNLSGIEKYNAYIDGNWVLLQYVPQKNYMFIDYSDIKNLPSGKHQLVVEIEDERKNLTKREYLFTKK